MRANNVTARKRKTTGEVNKELSLTVPGKTDKLRVILQRYARTGQMPPVAKPMYHDGMEDWDYDETLDPNFDLTDVDRVKKSIEDRKSIIEEITKKMEKAVKEAEKEKAENASKPTDQKQNQE